MRISGKSGLANMVEEGTANGVAGSKGRRSILTI